jgi:hypothetical protein
MKAARLSTLSTGRLYPQKIFLVLMSVRVCVDSKAMVRPQGVYQWKIPITPSGIDPATFRFVAQCVNHCATACHWILFYNEKCLRSCRENQNTHFMVTWPPPFFFRNRAFYEIMWENVVQRGRPQMTIRRMRIACCIPKATHSQNT